MYSKKVMEKLKNIGIGDIVRIISHDREFTGLLMPRPFSGDPDIIVIKLESGYNVGLKFDSIELIESSEAKELPKHKHEKSKKGDISILGCGGTIASRIEYKTGAVYPSITPQELRTVFPALEKWPIHSRQIFSLFSEDMNATHWRMLADEIEKEVKNGARGVVVMHGTDTMAYTSAAVSFMLQDLPVPVVFVGSQRSSDRPSSENETNLLNSVFSATKNVGEVMVCMHSSTNDDYCHLHRGTRVRKMHTSRRDAFRSIGTSPLFAVDYRTERFDPLSEYKPRSKKLISKKTMNDNVALIYTHPNIKPELISKLDSYDGIVLVGTGLGHVPANPFDDKTVSSIYKPVQELIQSGIPVVMTSQCISGRICMRVYATGRMLMQAGVIGDGADWTPESAYVKLCWAVGQTKDMKKIEELMMTNIAGEITDRSTLEES
ncbi:Glu-tRNA(Gln) amidotransferase subunit GatD [Candidatus Micrarchaeota archaeon]|nr:Glu-tRNA(Gln) amidotransferase subunit GatD [Candidatus Micrarchaeota archaeon]